MRRAMVRRDAQSRQPQRAQLLGPFQGLEQKEAEAEGKGKGKGKSKRGEKAGEGTDNPQ